MCKRCCRRLDYNFHIVWLTASLIGVLVHFAAIKTGLSHLYGACVADSGVSLPRWLLISGITGASDCAFVFLVLVLVCVDAALKNECYTIHLKGLVAVIHSLAMAWYMVWTPLGIHALTHQCEKGAELVVDLTIAEVVMSVVSVIKICVGLCLPVKEKQDAKVLEEHWKARRYLNQIP